MKVELHYKKGSETVASVPVPWWNGAIRAFSRNGLKFEALPQNVRCDRLEVVFTLPLDEWVIEPFAIRPQPKE